MIPHPLDVGYKAHATRTALSAKCYSKQVFWPSCKQEPYSRSTIGSIELMMCKGGAEQYLTAAQSSHKDHSIRDSSTRGLTYAMKHIKNSHFIAVVFSTVHVLLCLSPREANCEGLTRLAFQLYVARLLLAGISFWWLHSFLHTYGTISYSRSQMCWVHMTS